jgi:hypothetical protein
MDRHSRLPPRLTRVARSFERRGEGLDASSLLARVRTRRRIRRRARELIGRRGAVGDFARRGRDAAPPAATGGYFHTPAAGAKLPTGKWCADHIHRSLWEPRNDNRVQNRYVVRQPVHMPDKPSVQSPVAGEIQAADHRQLPRHHRQDHPWASCKWGFGDDLTLRVPSWSRRGARATNGDFESPLECHCTPEYRGNPCPTSSACCSRVVLPAGTYPGTKKSTAFMVDSALAETAGASRG